MSYINKSLAEIEPGLTDEFTSDVSPLVKRVQELRRKKLVDYSVEDLRLMIGQGQGLNYLVPMALDYLNKNPFAEGDYYEGDLLVNVLKCQCSFWKSHPEYLDVMNRIIESAIDSIEGIDLIRNIKDLIFERIESYRWCVSQDT